MNIQDMHDTFVVLFLFRKIQQWNQNKRGKFTQKLESFLVKHEYVVYKELHNVLFTRSVYTQLKTNLKSFKLSLSIFHYSYLLWIILDYLCAFWTSCYYVLYFESVSITQNCHQLHLLLITVVISRLLYLVTYNYEALIFSLYNSRQKVLLLVDVSNEFLLLAAICKFKKM